MMYSFGDAWTRAPLTILASSKYVKQHAAQRAHSQWLIGVIFHWEIGAVLKGVCKDR